MSVQSCKAAMTLILLFIGLFGLGYCSHNVNTGRRFRFPPFSQESNRQSAANDRWSDDSNNNIPDTDQDNINTQEDTQVGCTVVKTYHGYVPSAKTKVSFINAFETDEVKADQCVQACCEKGSTVCQYAWIIDRKCIIIGCTQEESELCTPTEFRHSSLESIYIQVDNIGSSIRADGNSVSTVPQETEYATVTPLVTITEGSEGAPTTNLVTPIQRPQGTTKVIAVTPSQVAQTTEYEITPTTLPPVSTLAATTNQKTSSNDHGIFVAVTGDTDITLPTNSVKLFGSTWPTPPSPRSYFYKWEKISGPEHGTMTGKDNKNVVLSGLVPGMYVLKLKAQSLEGSARGERLFNVTVHEAAHINSPPVPIILPSNNSQINLPQNSIVLDARTSRDDGGSDGLKFHWEEIAGPLDTDLEEVDMPLLKLSGLEEGVHLYKLTVTDSDGAVSVATANVTVLPEQDNKPIAHAGNPVIINLPNNEAILDGSQSKDEGVLQYKWTYLFGPGGGDMEGANTPKLHVKNLSQGDYQYLLTVTDSSGQTDTDTVSVIVTAENNTPPTAKAGGNVTVVFPVVEAVLNGNRSNDDYRITDFRWTQISGPTDVEVSGIDTGTLTVSGLHIDENVGSPTMYQFRLTVTDYGNLSDTDMATVLFMKSPRIPPVAVAGPDTTITLPQSTVVLNGKESHDDFGIVSYKWVRSEGSPAAGRVVDHSDQTPELILSSLVNGTYNFTLIVTNKNKETAQDGVTLKVLSDPIDMYLLQVYLEGNIAQFSIVDEDHFKRALSHILYEGEDEYDVTIVSITPYDSLILFEFYAEHPSSKTKMNTTNAYYKLTDKGQDYVFLNFHIVKVDMKVCQLPCSGHGTCNLKTKQCQCSTFWMENPLKSHFGKKESNCDWSVFYVVLVVFGAVAIILLFLWICCCCCVRRKRQSHNKRRIRYAMMGNKDQDMETIEMLPRDYKNTSLMVSESDTEEEILFESTYKTLNNDTGKGLKNNRTGRVRNGKIITVEDKVENHNTDSQK